MTCVCGREIILTEPTAFACECGRAGEVKWGSGAAMTIPAEPRTGAPPAMKVKLARREEAMTIELNTKSAPGNFFRDETPRIRCPRCGFWFLLGLGMDVDPVIEAITHKHLEVCEGDPAVALMKVEQAYKDGWRPQEREG